MRTVHWRSCSLALDGAGGASPETSRVFRACPDPHHAGSGPDRDSPRCRAFREGAETRHLDLCPDSAQGEAVPTLLHVANGNALVVWMAPERKARKYYYVAAQLKPKGGLASEPADIFGGKDWAGLDPFTAPVLVSQRESLS